MMITSRISHVGGRDYLIYLTMGVGVGVGEILTPARVGWVFNMCVRARWWLCRLQKLE